MALPILLMPLVIAKLAVAPLFTRSVTPAGAPPEKTSGEWAMARLPTFARQPRPEGRTRPGSGTASMAGI